MLSFISACRRQGLGSRLRRSLVFSGLSPSHLRPVREEEGGITDTGVQGEGREVGGDESIDQGEKMEVEIELHEQAENQQPTMDDDVGSITSPGPIPVSTGPDPVETVM